MFRQIDLSLKPQTPKLSICKPNKTIIANLPEANNITLKQSLTSSDELTFQIPYQIDKNHNFANNPHIVQCKNRYLIKLVLGELTEWFIIDNLSNNSDDSNEYLQIQAFSLEYELASRNIRNYTTSSILLKDVVNIALTGTTWTLGSIPNSVLNTYRTFDIGSTMTILAFILEIASKYNAIALFDTNNRQVNFYGINDIGQNKGLLISDHKYLLSLNLENDNANFCTRLKPYGNNNLTINRINPTGQNYIEDFSYFLYPFSRDKDKNVLTHSDYMSDELCQAQLNYQELIVSKTGEFKSLLNQLTGVAQVETTTVSGTITKVGNATVIVTANGMTGSPKTISVAVGLNDTASQVATKIISALSLDTDIGTFFMVGGSGTEITLTTTNLSVGNDDTLNINIDNGTCEGLISSTSVNTILGLVGYQPLLTKQQTELNALNDELIIINTNITNAIANTQDVTQYYTQKTTKQTEIAEKQSQIHITTAQISLINSQITSLQSQLSLNNSFTEELLKERNQFIVEKEWLDTSYIDDVDLYNSALDKMSEYNTPPLVMKINIVNFLEVISESVNWDKIVLGDTVTIKHPILNIFVKAKIMEVNFSFEDESIDLTISNISKIETAQQKILKLQYKADYTGNVIDNSKYDWNNALSNSQDYTNEQINNVNYSLLDLTTTINKSTKDGYITLTESKTLETSLNQLIHESLDIINIGQTLNLSTEVTNYYDSIFATIVNNGYDGLQAELNKWINQLNYPIYITENQRNTINMLFQTVQDSKSKLINAISSQRELRANKYSAKGNVYLKGTGLNRLANRILKVDDEEKYNEIGSGLRLVTLNRTDLSIVDNLLYDTYSSETAKNDLATKLNSLSDNVIVTLSSYDSIGWNTNLTNAVINCGGTGMLTETGRYPYAFIGIPNIGKGAGLEMFTTTEVDAPYAEISTKVLDGIPQGVIINGLALQAQQMASDAQTDANTANSLLTDIASDSKLTPSEKKATKKEWDIIVGEKPIVESQADLYSAVDYPTIATKKTIYQTKYNDLSTYITPFLSDLSTTSNIVGTDFRVKFKDYYDAKIDLLKEITSVAKTYTDNQISDVNTSLTNLTDDINNISSDNFISKAESNSLKSSLNQVFSESTDLIDIASKLGITIEKTNYQTALTNLQTELSKWIDKPDVNYPIAVTSVDRINIKTVFDEVQNRKTKLVNTLGELRNTNLSGWGIESGGIITYNNLTNLDYSPKSQFTGFTTATIPNTISVESTDGFPDFGTFYYTLHVNSNGIIKDYIIPQKYTSKDSTTFYLTDPPTNNINLYPPGGGMIYTYPSQPQATVMEVSLVYGYIWTTGTTGFPDSGVLYSYNNNKIIQQPYSSKDNYSFYFDDLPMNEEFLSDEVKYVGLYQNPITVDISVSEIQAVNNQNTRMNIPAKTWTNFPIYISFTGSRNNRKQDVGWLYVYIYIDSDIVDPNEKLQIAYYDTINGLSTFPPQLNVYNPLPYIWQTSVANYSMIKTNYPTPQEFWGVMCDDTKRRYIYLNSEWHFYDTYTPNAILVGYLMCGFGKVEPSGLYSFGNFDTNADNTPIWKIITKQDFRYRNDKLIQHDQGENGINLSTYGTNMISLTVSGANSNIPTIYNTYITYIPLGIGKRICDLSITSNTTKDGVDNLIQGAHLTVGRKPSGGSNYGIKVLWGVYVNADGTSAHVDQKRNSTTWGDYIIPPSALNTTYTTIYDLDVMPYPDNPSVMCLKVVLFNYSNQDDIVNLRLNWSAT